MKVLLCAIVKNENKYINEWLEHYKKLGFSKVILYDNNDINGEHIEHNFGNFVDVVNYRGKHISVNLSVSLNNHGIQEQAYNDCYLNYASNYDWVAFFDIDEFLIIDNNLTINEFLSQDKFNNIDAIQFNWQIYGDNNQIEYSSKPVKERFTTLSLKQTQHVKTIVRTNNPYFISVPCHYVNLKMGNFSYPNGNKTSMNYKQPINYEGAHINHYYTKSIEEWINRKYNATSATGKDYLNNNINRRISEFFQHNVYTVDKDLFAKHKIEESKIKQNITVLDKNDNIQNIQHKQLKVALCAIAKNENLYIKEWVKWYEKLGISKIFLYDNNEINGEKFEDVINDYIRNGFVKIINKRGITKTTNDDQDGQTLQGLSYKECYDNYYNEYDWMCFFDIDEFLEINENYNLQTFLNIYNDSKYDGIRVQWRMYGDNNLLYYDDRSVFERFYNKRNESNSSLIKSIIKCKEHHKNNLLFCAHGPVKISGKYKQINMINADFSQATNPYRNLHNLKPNMPAYLNHFYCKSTEEFINRKWKKTSAVTGINQNRNYNIDFIKEQYFKHTNVTNAKLQLFDNLVKKQKRCKKLNKNDKIIVNFTTWRKRDMYVPILLKFFKNQTLKPDKIICWLSKDEYNGVIPDSIKYCLDNKLLTDVKFVDGNIYGHKRYETFKFNNNAYNILIDDDIYYPIDYVEKLYKTCKENSNNVVCYYSRREIYKTNGFRTYTDIIENASFDNRYFSGLACFSPNTFPIESFNYSELRNIYCQKCDDSWINAWLFKKHIKVYAINNWGKRSPLNIIGNTQEDGIYETHNGLHINGVLQASINIANAICIVNVKDISKRLWPEFNIDDIATYKQ